MKKTNKPHIVSLNTVMLTGLSVFLVGCDSDKCDRQDLLSNIEQLECKQIKENTNQTTTSGSTMYYGFFSNPNSSHSVGS